MDVANMPKVVPIGEREWFVLFAICVAGKSAKQTQAKLNVLLQDMLQRFGHWNTPFQSIWFADKCGALLSMIQERKMGQYKRISNAFREVIKLDITKDLTVDKLEAIPGIGPKTARFICLYTDEHFNGVPLDTHILKYLAKHFPGAKVPKSTPTGRKYKELELLFQESAKAQNKTVRQLDTEVWQSYAKGR